eukprot:4236191-Amphidinium_carterae.1
MRRNPLNTQTTTSTLVSGKNKVLHGQRQHQIRAFRMVAERLHYGLRDVLHRTTERVRRTCRTI